MSGVRACEYGVIMFCLEETLCDVALSLISNTLELTIYKCSHHRPTAVSCSDSIIWDNCEAILVTWTGVGSGKDVVWLYEVVTVITWHIYWVEFICHIGDEDSVPDVRILPRHIQGEWRAPGEEDEVTVILHCYITNWSQ